MQPLHYDSRCPAAKDNSITHAAVAPSNLDAAYNAICRHWVPKHNRATRKSAGNCSSKTGSRRQRKKTRFWSTKKKIFKRKIISAKIGKIRWQIILTDLMQPFQYNLQCPAAQDTSITHAAMAPSNLDAAMTMRFETSGCNPASLDAHGNTTRQQSCSRYTAICNQRFNKRIESRTHEQPLVAENGGGTDRARFDRSRTRRTDEVPFIAGRSHFTRKNARFPAPAFSQNEAHATSMQPLQCVLQHHVASPHLSTHMATQNGNNHAAVTLRSATRV